MKTGNLTLKTESVVHSIIYDEDKNKAVGVRVINAHTKRIKEYFAKVIFLNASTLNTNLILLNSTSDRFPNGLGNDSGLLGKYIAFHNYRGVISATHEGHIDKRVDGRKPTSAYVPRFRNVYRQETNFLRGYAAGFGASKKMDYDATPIGDKLHNNLINAKQSNVWTVNSHMMGETIPKENNQVTLDESLVDPWGIPQLKVDVDYDDNDEKMLQDFFDEFSEMYSKAGFTNIKTNDNGRIPGNDIHEMGGVRMGSDPKTSLLNQWNQMHHCQNVFVTDGACMTSTSTQNPSLTFMALTARAAHHAIEEMKKGNI